MTDSMQPRPAVLIIDSGIGGLSICKSILDSGISADLRYLADNAAFPYGSKSDAFLIERLESLISQAVSRFRVDMIVLACNTVSTLVLPRLRSIFDLPIVGVVPAIKPAAALSKNGVIGLLATPGTVRRPYTQKLIQDFASEREVIQVGSSVLVEQAEHFLLDGRLDVKAIEAELQAFKNTSVIGPPDTIVLGCTHFPFLKEILAQAMPGVAWVDSGEAIARRVESLLNVNYGESQADHAIYFTGTTPGNDYFRERLQAIGFLSVTLGQISE